MGSWGRDVCCARYLTHGIGLTIGSWERLATDETLVWFRVGVG